MRLITSRPALRQVCNGAFALIALLFISLSAIAHEGHDHGEADKPAAPSSAFPRVVARSELYEIVGVLKDRELTVYVDDSTTNEPVSGALVEVTIGDAKSQAAAETMPGLYVVALEKAIGPGNVEVIFSVTGAKGDDLLVDALPVAPPTANADISQSSSLIALSLIALVGLAVAALLAYQRRRYAATVSALLSLAAAVLLLTPLAKGKVPKQTEIALAQSDAPRRLPDGSAFVAKSTQRLLDVRLASAKLQSVQPATTLTGRIIGDPDRRSIVQSIYGGRVLASDKRSIPRIGQTVQKGDVLLEIDPVIPVADRTTIQEKIGEIEQLIAVTETKLARLRPLGRSGIVATGQIDDLESELAGLRARRQSVLQTRSTAELLRAPTDGIVTMAKVVAGQVIQPQDVVLEIADPKGLWVEALSYGDFSAGAGMTATAALPNGQSFELSYLGVSRALRQHASVIQFSIPEPPQDLNIGQLLSINVQNGSPVNGYVLPREAIVRSSNGENIIWAQTGAERFETRSIRILPLDSSRVVAAAGLNGGERVVVRAADLVNQIR